jgi:capsular polysaccharide biosynthesis protein
MEASEAIRRIFWRNRWLLLALVLLPVAAVVPLREHKPVTYAATAEVQGQSGAPDSSTQVTAIQSRVTAAATSPALVQQAITAVGVSRNATQVARRDVAVAPLGSSAVMLITVTDASRQVAIKLAGSLATVVVNELNQLGTRSNPQLSALNAATLKLTTQRDKLIRQLNAAQASGKPTTSVNVQSLLAQLTAVEQQISSNMSAVQQILANVSSSTGAQLMSTPTYATGVSRHVAAYGALAGLLGLVVGLLIATIREVIRPTIAQPGAGARELGVVFLGNAETGNGKPGSLEAGVAGHLNLAAQRFEIRTAVLAGPVPRWQLTELADLISGELSAAEPGAGGTSMTSAGASQSGRTSNDGTGRDGHRPRMTMAQAPPAIVALPDISLATRPEDPALIVVLPRYAPHYALDRITDLGVSTNWPIIGVIGLRKHKRRGRAHRSEPARPGQEPPLMTGAADDVRPARSADEDPRTQSADDIPPALPADDIPPVRPADGISPARSADEDPRTQSADDIPPAQSADELSPAQSASGLAAADGADQRGALA